jgi:hypothetical protein
MKRTSVALIGFIAIVLSSPVFAATPYQHETVLCAALDSRQPSAPVLQKLGEEFFNQEDVRSVTDFPLVARETFVKGEDDRVFILSRWYGLSAQRAYTFLCEWIDPNGEPYDTTSASFRTPESLDPSVFFTHTAYLNVREDLKEGSWTVRLFLNGDLIETRGLTITSD